MLTPYDPKKHAGATEFYVRCGGYDEEKQAFWDGWCLEAGMTLADATALAREDPYAVMVEVSDEAESVDKSLRQDAGRGRD